MKLSFTIPGHPVGWQRTGGNGKRRFTPAKTRAYEKAIKQCAQFAVDFEDVGHGFVRRHPSWPTTVVDYQLRCRAFTKNRIRPDVDNLLKAVMDGMQGAAYENDKRVVSASICWSVDSENPRMEVEVEVMARRMARGAA